PCFAGPDGGRLSPRLSRRGLAATPGVRIHIFCVTNEYRNTNYRAPASSLPHPRGTHPPRPSPLRSIRDRPGRPALLPRRPPPVLHHHRPPRPLLLAPLAVRPVPERHHVEVVVHPRRPRAGAQLPRLPAPRRRAQGEQPVHVRRGGSGGAEERLGRAPAQLREPRPREVPPRRRLGVREEGPLEPHDVRPRGIAQHACERVPAPADEVLVRVEVQRPFGPPAGEGEAVVQRGDLLDASRGGGDGHPVPPREVGHVAAACDEGGGGGREAAVDVVHDRGVRGPVGEMVLQPDASGVGHAVLEHGAVAQDLRAQDDPARGGRGVQRDDVQVERGAEPRSVRDLHRQPASDHPPQPLQAGGGERAQQPRQVAHLLLEGDGGPRSHGPSVAQHELGRALEGVRNELHQLAAAGLPPREEEGQLDDRGRVAAPRRPRPVPRHRDPAQHVQRRGHQRPPRAVHRLPIMCPHGDLAFPRDPWRTRRPRRPRNRPQ
ncbi:hypothetical protein DFJ74DRAFT_721198, partial [Hyaloraphidium curvatum]